MAEQRARREGSGRESSKREEREQRILDAAAELLQKWGYRKTTLEDIARIARVAKGTIYLSWKTREELFIALIEREQASLYVDIMRRMEEDPDGMTLPGLIKHSILATLKNPLMKALVLQDADFLGELITREMNAATYQVQLQGYIAMLDVLRKCGVIRSDIDLREQAITIVSVSWGFLLIDQLLPSDFKFFSDEHMAERINLTLKRLLEPDSPLTNEQCHAGKRAFKEYVERYMVISEQQEHKVIMGSETCFQ